MSRSPSNTSTDSEFTPLVGAVEVSGQQQPQQPQPQQPQQQPQQQSIQEGKSGSGSGISSGDYNRNFYFLNSTANSVTNASQPSHLRLRLGQHVIEHEIERLPHGATEDEFASRPVTVMGAADPQISNRSEERGLFSMIFGSKTPNGFQPNGGNVGSSNVHGDVVGVGDNISVNPNQNPNSLSPMMRERQAAIKIEPKVFFSNERTFLAWLHSAVLLAGASIALTSKYSNRNNSSLANQLYGIVLLPVAIAFMVYAMHQYGRRSQMIRRRAPGPYEDIIGPSVLAVALMLSIVVQFSLKLYTTLTYSRNFNVVAEN